jgi:hypothetical protein
MDASIAVIRLSGEFKNGRQDEITGALRLAGEEPRVLLDFSQAGG